MMPAGEYYIGDLCYVMTDEEWEEFCSITISTDDKCLDGEFQLKDGRRFATYGTMYGDGIYYDHYGYDNLLDFGAIQKFDTDFVTGGGKGIKGWENGEILFGHIVIETNPMEEEYE